MTRNECVAGIGLGAGRSAFGQSSRFFARVALAVGLVLWVVAAVAQEPPEGAVPTAVRQPASTAAGKTVGEVLEKSSSRPAKADSSEAGTHGTRITIDDYLQVLGWLVVVVGLAIATIAGLRRLQRGGRRDRAGRLMEVVGRTSLTAKHQLAAVRVGERILIVGISPEGLHGISELTDPREVVPLTVQGGFTRVLGAEQAAERETPEVEESETPTHRREIRNLRRMVGNWRGARPGSERPR